VYEVQMSRHLFAHVPVHKEQDSKQQPAKRLQALFFFTTDFFFLDVKIVTRQAAVDKKIEP
jgi:hypothetical protein